MQSKIVLNIEEEKEIGIRVDAYLAHILDDFTRSRIQNLIKEDQAIKINGEVIKPSYKLKYEDEIEINLPQNKELKLEAQDIQVEICYEDDDMLIVNKPSGMLTHPTSIEKTNTLVNALLYYCKNSLSGINGVMRPGILHRLDRDTSGLLMIAKNDFAHNFLAKQVKEKSAKRQYLAIVNGVVKTDFGTITGNIGRHKTQRHKMAIIEDGKPATTHFKVLKRYEKFSLVEATLETGRTHQIRVHFSSKLFPIAGDPLYGGKNININLDGQALQAYKLTFQIPSTKEIKVIEIEPDLKIKKLDNILKEK